MIDFIFNYLQLVIITILLVGIASSLTGFVFSYIVIVVRREHFTSMISAYIADSIIFSACGILTGYISASLVYHRLLSPQELINSEESVSVLVMVWLLVGIIGTFFKTRHLSK